MLLTCHLKTNESCQNDKLQKVKATEIVSEIVKVYALLIVEVSTGTLAAAAVQISEKWMEYCVQCNTPSDHMIYMLICTNVSATSTTLTCCGKVALSQMSKKNKTMKDEALSSGTTAAPLSVHKALPKVTVWSWHVYTHTHMHTAATVEYGMERARKAPRLWWKFVKRIQQRH